MQTRICKHCHEELPIEQFAMNRKDGKGYRLHKCNACRHHGVTLSKIAEKHRAFNRLIGWKP